MAGIMKFFEERKHWGPAVLRIFLGVAFIVAGLDKVLGLGMAREMFGQLFGANLAWLVYVSIVIEIVCGAALVLNRKVRESAAILAVFIVVAFIVTFKLGAAPNFIATLREIMVMNTGGGNTAVNFAYFAGLLALAFMGSKGSK